MPGFTYCLFSVVPLVEEINRQKIILRRNEDYFNSDWKNDDIRYSGNTGVLSYYEHCFHFQFKYSLKSQTSITDCKLYLFLNQTIIFGVENYFGKFKRLKYCSDTITILNLLYILC